MKGSPPLAVAPRPLNATERLASALRREAEELTHAMENAATSPLFELLRGDRARVDERVRRLELEPERWAA